MLQEMLQCIVVDFKQHPRNKVFLPWEAMLQSVKEELGREVSSEELKASFIKVLEGGATEEDDQLYDAAISPIGDLATHCFFQGDYDKGYSYSILEQEWGFVAEIRP